MKKISKWVLFCVAAVMLAMPLNSCGSDGDGKDNDEPDDDIETPISPNLDAELIGVWMQSFQGGSETVVFRADGTYRVDGTERYDSSTTSYWEEGTWSASNGILVEIPTDSDDLDWDELGVPYTTRYSITGNILILDPDGSGGGDRYRRVQ